MKYCIQNKDIQLHIFAEECFKSDIREDLEYLESKKIKDLKNKIRLFKEAVLLDWYDTELDEELRYKNWKVVNHLVLNSLNEYDQTIMSEKDFLHLPNITRPVKEKQHIYGGLFNQIKQEYCSARYFIFDGMYNKKIHFLDKNVFLINMYDYPVYGINIEKNKAGYKILDLSNENYLLKSLYWIYKDIYNVTKSGFKGKINQKLDLANSVRNTMEHKYLKIVENSTKDESDELADLIIERKEGISQVHNPV